MYNVIMDLRVSLAYIFIMCVALCTVTATKESVNDAEVAVLAKKLYDEIQKRLIDYGDKVDGLQDVDMNKFLLQNETIIKTTNSLDRGAKFLNNSVVESREECARLCLTNEQCNIAVFHNKKSFSCYLFNCGTPSVCEFSSHPDYVTMGLPLRKTGLSQQKKHELDLANLPASITSVSTTTTTTTTPTTSVSTRSPTTTTASTTTTTATRSKPKMGKVQGSSDTTFRVSPVMLFGKCGPLLGQCTDHYTECLTGICVCQEGYHPQDGTCRKECDRFEFECTNLGRPLVYPQCIAVYDKCDGVAQCSDGSDELNCPAGPKDGDKLSDEHKTGGETSIKEKTLPPPTGDKSTVPPVKATTVKPAKTTTDLGDKAQLPELSKNDIVATSSDKKIVHSKNVADNDAQPEPHKTSGSLSSKVVEKAGEVVVISKEVIGSAVVHHKAKSDRGAVVALGLGLGVTAVLLLFVGCRLRNMKRKLRRGRPMNSNEADYLINGMYL